MRMRMENTLLEMPVGGKWHIALIVSLMVHALAIGVMPSENQTHAQEDFPAKKRKVRLEIGKIPPGPKKVRPKPVPVVKKIKLTKPETKPVAKVKHVMQKNKPTPKVQYQKEQIVNQPRYSVPKKFIEVQTVVAASTFKSNDKKVTRRTIETIQTNKPIKVSVNHPVQTVITPTHIDPEVEKGKGKLLNEIKDHESQKKLGDLLKAFSIGIQKKIARNKVYPSFARKLGHQGKTQVSFELGKDGTLLALAISKSSGFEILDEAALDAVRNAGPYPSLPKELNKESLTFQLPISFILE